MKALIIGGGFAGTTIAHLLTRAGWRVSLLEKEQHLGGGCRTLFHCGHPFTYGPRLYYGYSRTVFAWVNAVVPLRRFPFELKTLAHEPVDADREFWTYPMHEADLRRYPRSADVRDDLDARDNTTPPADFDAYWKQKVGPTLYDMFVDHYSRRMWMIADNRELDTFKWSAKDRPIETGTREAYKGSYIAYPIEPTGYNRYFDVMTEGVEVVRGCEFPSSGLADLNAGGTGGPDVVVSTMPIDDFVGKPDTLPYAGREFHLLILPCRQILPGDVRWCHYAGAGDEWTRVTEFKKITYHDAANTLLVLEKPSRVNKLYPFLTRASEALARSYVESLPGNVHSIGRLGTFKYSTIEQTIVQAFQCAARILGTRSPEGCEDEWRGIGDVSMMKERKE